jgi:hypothetical protein
MFSSAMQSNGAYFLNYSQPTTIIVRTSVSCHQEGVPSANHADGQGRYDLHRRIQKNGPAAFSLLCSMPKYGGILSDIMWGGWMYHGKV